MPSFTDRKGQTWDVSLTLAGARRIEASDFTELTKNPVVMLEPSRELLGEMYTRGALIAAMVWALCQPQAIAAGIDENEFVERIDGRTLDEMRKAWQEALADFFPQYRTVLKRLSEHTESVRQRLNDGLMEILETDAQAEIDRGVERMLGEARAIFAVPPGTTS